MEQNKLETGSVGKLLVSLSLPMICAQLVTLLYNVVDRMFIGQMENGTLAMAGIGVSGALVMVIGGFSQLFGAGGAPLAAISMGKKDNESAERIMTASFTCLVLTAVVITVVFPFVSAPVLRLFGASDEVLPDALDYCGVYCLGTVFVEITLGMNAFINTQGFARTGMATVMVGAALNIALDPLFIFVLGMGVKGAAWATVISQGVSGVWVLAFLFGKKSTLHIRREFLLPKAKIVGQIMKLGLSPFFMEVSESAMLACFNNQLLRFGGDLAVGSMTILFSLLDFIYLPISGISKGAQPILSYNYGAGNYDRVRKTLRLSLIVGTGFSLAGALLMMVFPRPFIAMFTSDTELLRTASRMLPIYIAGNCVLGANTIFQQSYNALDEGVKSFCFAFFRKMVLLIPLLYILPAAFPQWGVMSVVLAEPVSDFLTTCANSVVFSRFIRKKVPKIFR